MIFTYLILLCALLQLKKKQINKTCINHSLPNPLLNYLHKYSIKAYILQSMTYFCNVVDKSENIEIKFNNF